MKAKLAEQLTALLALLAEEPQPAANKLRAKLGAAQQILASEWQEPAEAGASRQPPAAKK